MRCAILLFILSSICSATKLTLKEAYLSALTKNESVGIQNAEAGASEERVSQAFGKVLPSLSLIGSYTRQEATADQSSARANITQPLFHGLSEFAGYRALKAKARSQKALENQSRLTLYKSSASVYYDLLSAQFDLATVRNLTELTSKRVKDLRERVKIGRSKKADILSLEAQFMSLTAQLEGAKASLRQAEEQFVLTTGLDGSFELEFPKQLPPSAGAAFELQKQVEQRQDIISAREEALAAEESVSAARGSHWPQIDAFGNYYFDRTGTLKDVKWDLGVTVTFPLFQGGSIQASVRESLEAHKGKSLALSYARRQAQSEIRTLSDKYSSILAQHTALREAAALSEQNYKEQSRDYKYGLVSNLEVLQAMNTLQENKRAMDRTFFQALKTYAELEVSRGKNPFETTPP